MFEIFSKKDMVFSENVRKKTLLLAAVVFAFYISILIISDLETIASNFFKINFEYYLIIFPLLILRLFVYGLRFHVLLKKTNLNTSLKENFSIYIAGLSMILTPGGIGSLIKSYILKEKTGKSFSSSAPVMVYEKWIDLTVLVGVIGFLLIWTNFIESWIIFVIGLIFSVTLLTIIAKVQGFGKINRVIQKIPILKNKQINSEEYQTTIRKLLESKFTVGIILVSIIPRIITMLIILLVFKSFGLDFDIFSSSQLFFTSTLIGILSFVPAGIIVTETSLVGMLILRDIEFEIATLLTIILRFVNVWFFSIIGLIFLKVVFRNVSEKSK